MEDGSLGCGQNEGIGKGERRNEKVVCGDEAGKPGVKTSSKKSCNALGESVSC